MRPLSTDLRCRCGSEDFALRANATESVGLASCSNGHHAFILDSRDVWFDVIQEGRPRQLRCRCKGSLFRLAVHYEFCVGTTTVRVASARACCTVCRASRDVFSADIDYEPTELLLERPLDPVDDPWLKARRVEVTGLWRPGDLESVLRFAGGLPNARLLFAPWGAAVAERSVDDVVQALASTRSFSIFIACEHVALPTNTRDAWRSLPVVHIGSPTHIHYARSEGDLYYVTYAIEDIRDGQVVPRSAAFTTFADALRAWLSVEFSARRGKRAADNPAEYHRLFGDGQ